MKRIPQLLLLIGVVLSLRAALPAAGQGLDLRVSGASAQRVESMAGSADLTTRLAGVGQRITATRAMAARQDNLAYPREVIKDSTPPRLTRPVELRRRGGGELSITWGTDELTTGLVEYRTQAGAYTARVELALLAYDHEAIITVPELTSEAGRAQVLYYRVSGADRSGNSLTPIEGQLQAGTSVFLPALHR